MPVVFVIAVLVVLVGVFFAATGRGGELAYEQTDHAPLDLGPVSAPDIALLRPPTALWGYNMQVTDEALDHIARAVRDRDITIAYLQEELANRESTDPNAPYGNVPPTRPDASYPLTDRDGHPQAAADAYPLAAADAYPLAGADASRYPDVLAPSDAGPAPVTPDAPPQSLSPPGVLVASRRHEAVQPQEVPEAYENTRSAAATQPSDVAEPREATQPSETLPGADDALGPQGPFDTHDWWGEQEEAAREDTRRQAEAQNAGRTPLGESRASEPRASEPRASEPSAVEPSAVEPSAVEPSAVEPSAVEPAVSEATAPESVVSEPAVSEGPAPADAPSGSAAEDTEPPDEAADQAGVFSGPTGTVPNPVVSPPSETGTSPGDAGQPSTGPAKPLTPHDDGLSIAEEQAW